MVSSLCKIAPIQCHMLYCNAFALGTARCALWASGVSPHLYKPHVLVTHNALEHVVSIMLLMLVISCFIHLRRSCPDQRLTVGKTFYIFRTQFLAAAVSLQRHWEQEGPLVELCTPHSVQGSDNSPKLGDLCQGLRTRLPWSTPLRELCGQAPPDKPSLDYGYSSL